MKTLRPTQADIDDLTIAIKSFKDAWGSVLPDGQYNPDLDPNQLWMMSNIDGELMAALWEEAGISTHENSTYSKIRDSQKHIMNIRIHKISKGLASSYWIGNVLFLLDDSEIFIGSQSAKTQSALWLKIHNFIGFRAKLFNSTKQAEEAV